MIPELTILRYITSLLRQRITAIKDDPDAGYSTEAVVVIALLVAMAITAVGIITAKVLSTAHNISTGSGG